MSDFPEPLKPYRFHGMDIDPDDNHHEVVVECPFCSKEKFHINQSNGLWKCFTCDAGGDKGGGNSTAFLQELWKLASDTTQDYSKLSKDRQVEDTTLIQWEVVKNPLNGKWMVPGYTLKGTINQLYKYTKIKGKNRLLATPTKDHPHCLFGVGLFDPEDSIVYLCEGPWDAMALWEQLQRIDENLRGSVIATPGTNVFKDSWTPLFSGKDVNILFDNDHPRVNKQSGKLVEGAGIAGARRVTAILSSSSKPPNEIQYLQWGEEGFDSDLPSGSDIRDFINA